MRAIAARYEARRALRYELVRLAVAIGGISVCASIAWADAKQDARATADQGIALFEQHDFAGAAAKFEAAYALDRNPEYLFNGAQAYRHGGDCIRAADLYGRFLSAVPQPPNEDKIRVWYASQMQCAKERAVQLPSQSAEQPPLTEPRISEELPPLPSTSPGGHRGLAIALGATGVASLAVGGFFAWDAGYLSDRRAAYLAQCTTDARCASDAVNDYDRRGSRAQTLALVGLAVGGVAVAASATLFVLSRSKEPTPALSITPVDGGVLVGRSIAW